MFTTMTPQELIKHYVEQNKKHKELIIASEVALESALAILKNNPSLRKGFWI